jgi:hypothetical protein
MVRLCSFERGKGGLEAPKAYFCPPFRVESGRLDAIFAATKSELKMEARPKLAHFWPQKAVNELWVVSSLSVVGHNRRAEAF